MTKTINPKELAELVGSDARTVRKFLRKDAEINGTETPGKGSRWEIDSRKVSSLKKKFITWSAETDKTDDELSTED